MMVRHLSCFQYSGRNWICQEQNCTKTVHKNSTIKIKNNKKQYNVNETHK